MPTPLSTYAQLAANTVALRRVVVVSQLPGVTGDGSSGNPYVGWSSAIGAGAANTVYEFDPFAIFQTATTFSPLGFGQVFRGENTTIKYTGSGTIWKLDGRPSPSTQISIERVKIRGFILDGNSTATTGLYMDCIHHARVRDVVVKNMLNTGSVSTAFDLRFMIYPVLENLEHTSFYQTSDTMAYYGLKLGQQNVWNGATAYVVGDLVARPAGGNFGYYYRLIAGTTSTIPESDPTNWRNDSSAPRACVCRQSFLQFSSYAEVTGFGQSTALESMQSGGPLNSMSEQGCERKTRLWTTSGMWISNLIRVESTSTDCANA